jgi:hypothetical protein
MPAAGPIENGYERGGPGARPGRAAMRGGLAQAVSSTRGSAGAVVFIS